jgi:cysteinyl-tRNA synthetase
MSVKYLGETYDLHGGGADLLFPHHENELAQSRALGYPYVKYWFHNGVLNLAGEKMSKSTGNFFAVDDVLKHFTARVLRFYCLYGNLRRARDFNWERLVESQAAFERLQRTVSKLDGLLDGAVTVSPGDTQGLDELSRRLISAAADAERGFRERLADDFDAEGALVQLFELARFVNSVTPELETLESRMSSGVQACWDVFHQAFHILGLSDAAHQIPDIPEEMVQLARERDEARKRRDFATADAIRSQIEHRGYSIGDGPKGTTLRRSI